MCGALAVLTLIAMTMAPAALAGEPGSWMARVRLINIMPDEEGTTAALSSATVDDNFTIEVDLTYFFTENWAIEAIAATSGHQVNVPDVGVYGSLRHLPPTINLQYHFAPDGRYRPYLGFGVNYTMVYETAGDLDLVDVDDSFGFAAQAGMDFAIGPNTVFNLDIKYIDISFEVTDVDGVLVESGTVLGDVDVNPWVIGFGFGYQF